MTKFLGLGTSRSRSGFLFLGLALASLGAGCGMFDIREPTPPIRPSCVPHFANQSRAESVLVNFAASFGCQVEGQQQYEGTLAEAFHMVLDPFDKEEIQATRDSLSKSLVSDAYRIRCQEKPDSFVFVFADVDPTQETDQTAYYLDIPYELRILQAQGDTLAVIETIAGTSDIFLAEDNVNAKWVITRWVDQRTGSVTSLGKWYGLKVGSS